MGMICRPILLHNEYVPAIVGERDYEYLVLGHHDGMTVEETFSIGTDESFEKTFFLKARYEGRKSDYSTQFFFGFHQDQEMDKVFWESDYPFTLVSFIQFESRELSEYQRYLESRQYVEDELKALGLRDRPENIRTIAYYALDNSDLILAIKCRYCDTGTHFINNLHQDIRDNHPFCICNSYSILAINRQYIEDESRRKLVEGSIKQMELRIVEKRSGSVKGIYEGIEQMLKAQKSAADKERCGLLGTEDEAVVIKNVLWRDFLSLYKEGTGVLLNSNECSQKYAAAITSKMLYSILPRISDEESGMPEGENKTPGKCCNTSEANCARKSICDFLYKKAEAIYRGQDTASAAAERENLVMLINALRKTEYSHYAEKPFNDYCFYTIMMPTVMFVRLRERVRGNAVEFYEFIKYVKLCMQNFTKPDRVYQQITDFNIRYFDIPSKLLALYNAYLYYAKQILNVGVVGEYEFLLCPGMNEKTEVKELYQGTDGEYNVEKTLQTKESHHLFRVEIPESQAYNPKIMFFTLGHEVSHFVGRVIRRREDRYESIIEISSRMVMLGIKEHIGYVQEFAPECFESEFWDDMQKKVASWLKFYIINHLEEDYLEKVEYNPSTPTDIIKRQRDYYEVFYQHTSTLKLLLSDAINRILLLKREDLFEALLWKDVSAAIDAGRISYERRQQYYEKQRQQLDKCIDAFLGMKVFRTHALTAANGIEDMMFLLEECYADLSCILLLRLPLKDYLGNLIEILRTTGHTEEEVEETKLVTRVAVIMSVMSTELEPGDQQEECFRWNDNQILSASDIEEDVFRLQTRAIEFTRAYIAMEADIEPGSMAGDVQRISRDQTILREVIRYLLKCRREYYRSVEHEQEQKVREFYGLADISDTSVLFEKVAVILKQYETDIYDEIQRLIEREQ